MFRIRNEWSEQRRCPFFKGLLQDMWQEHGLFLIILDCIAVVVMVMQSTQPKEGKIWNQGTSQQRVLQKGELARHPRLAAQLVAWQPFVLTRPIVAIIIIIISMIAFLASCDRAKYEMKLRTKRDSGISSQIWIRAEHAFRRTFRVSWDRPPGCCTVASLGVRKITKEMIYL